ncbi:hypothetical protein K438DRAFT_1597939, partial [Mycena galopus ATCC 62051]
EGLSAYALEQATCEEAWLAMWGVKWEKVHARMQMILQDHPADVTEEVELDNDKEGLSGDEDFGDN